jgi:hypothetical protein
MLTYEPVEKTAIELPINVVTEWKNRRLPGRSRDECSRNKVTASLCQRAKPELTESAVVIPERPVHTMLNLLALRRRAERFPRRQALDRSCLSIADVIEAKERSKYEESIDTAVSGTLCAGRRPRTTSF